MVQLSDDESLGSGPLISLSAAHSYIRARYAPTSGCESVLLAAGLGRILREDVYSGVDIPAGDNSAVDGYGFRFADLSPLGETRFRVAMRLSAGEYSSSPLPLGMAARVFTGALLPLGVDTVMMQEDCRLSEDLVTLCAGIPRGANVRRCGEDISCGSRVLACGRRLWAQDLAQAAAVGRRHLEMSVPLRVGIFSTGNELCAPGSLLPPGCIYDSNGCMLSLLLRGLGLQVEDLGILADDRALVLAAFSKVMDYDLVVTSGGVSVGAQDHVRAAIGDLGAVDLWRLAIKPGRPVVCGRISSTIFVGLPGNPAAAFTAYIALLRPLIFHMLAACVEEPRRFPVTLGFAHSKRRGRREWLRVCLESYALASGVCGWRARRAGRAGAGMLSSLVEAEGFVELPEEREELSAGETVAFLPMSSLL